MKIAVIFTGGTIGSRIDETGYISPNGGNRYLLLNNYEEKHGKNVDFEIFEPYRILSENLSATNLRLLIETVSKIIKSGEFEGIIITHGTDTLQYTASMLPYVFADYEYPIVLVSSAFVLSDVRANGHTNFEKAVSFIEAKAGNGVFVSYKNTTDTPAMHRGNRLQNALSFSDDVSSILGSHYGKWIEDNYISNEKYIIAKGNVNTVFPADKIKLDEDSSKIVRIKAMPGMCYPDISDCKAVLYEGYHSGTVCIGEKLKAFANKAKAVDIPIFVTGLTDSEAMYETVEKYKELGIIPLVNCSAISQYCKLWLTTSNDLPILDIMSKSVAEDWCF